MTLYVTSNLMNVVPSSQEHRTEMDARAGTFQAFELLGQQLLQNQHYASEDVQVKLEELAKSREELEQWVAIIIHYFFIFDVDGLALLSF